MWVEGAFALRAAVEEFWLWRGTSLRRMEQVKCAASYELAASRLETAVDQNFQTAESKAAVEDML